MLVDKHCDLAVMALDSERFGKHGYRAMCSGKPEYQRNHTKLRLRNSIEHWKLVLVVAVASHRATDAVPAAAPVRTEVAHQAQTPNAAAVFP